jgi:NodT family efflux transporter outer membrane factor (OMF) lipoprotein
MTVTVRFSIKRYVQHVLAKAIVCNLLLVLPSCAIPRLRQVESAPNLPTSFNGSTTTGNSSQLEVTEFFNDSTLSCLIDQAVVGNRELKILDEEVQIASNEILARRGAYFPFVAVGANAGLDRHSLFTPMGATEKNVEYLPGKNFPDPLPNFLGGLFFSWQLDIWRELRNARDAATQRYNAARERRTYFVTRLVAEVVENYYGLMALDKRLEVLDQNIELQEQSAKLAKAKLDAGKGTALAVQRFQAEVHKNRSEKLIVQQEIVQAENRINFLLNRYPQPVERVSANFLDLTINTLNVGTPAQLLQNRPDIRQAEHEVEAVGLDLLVARAHFYPKVDITAGVGYQAFNLKYLFEPEALIYNVAGNLAAPLVNKKAIQAEYMSANAKQLQSLYNYQRVVLNAFTEVINRMAKVENYTKSIEIKKQQLKSLEASVATANNLFQNARAEYVEVLLAQRDLLEARTVLIETKKEQLSAIVNAYQALGGGAGVTRGSPRLCAPVATTLPSP